MIDTEEFVILAIKLFVEVDRGQQSECLGLACDVFFVILRGL